jgi:ElaB/YqjD/DUF883 family membrane-anchored ribosome-binding protein
VANDESKGGYMANVQDPTKPNAPTSTSTLGQHEHRRADEEWNRTQGTGTQARDKTPETGTRLRESAQETGQQLYDKAQELGMQAQQLGTQVKETASQYYEQGREGLQELNKTLEAQIREKPLQSLLIAGGVGLLVGLLWRRS